VPYEILDFANRIGSNGCVVDTLRRNFHTDVPDEINGERGRLLNMISNMHQYTYNKRVALWGDPDQLVALTQFLVLLNMRPVYIVTGTPGNNFIDRINAVLNGIVPEAKCCKAKGQICTKCTSGIKQEGVDLLIGNTYGKYIARDENTPFIRAGFPILDRVGHQYFPIVGYKGAMRLCEMILNAFSR